MALKDLMNSKFQGELTEGEHTMTLISWTYMAHETDSTKDYLALTFKHAEGEYKRNFFERDLTIALSHIRRQLNRSNETIIPTEFLTNLIKDQTPLKTWITYPNVTTTNGLRRVQNLHFLEPYGKMDTETAEPDMEVPA